MSEHTPGPFYIVGDDELDGMPFIEIAAGDIGTPEFKPIAHIQPSLGDDDDFYLSDEDRANADLLAAAPETVAERDRLRWTLKTVEPEIGWRGDGVDKDIFYCEFCKASHEDSTLIEHRKSCLMLKIRAALSDTAPSEADRLRALNGEMVAALEVASKAIPVGYQGATDTVRAALFKAREFKT